MNSYIFRTTLCRIVLSLFCVGLLSACGNSTETTANVETVDSGESGNEEQELAQFTLLAQASGQGSVSPAKSIVDNGSVISLSATPDAGWQFDRWSGDLSGTINPTSVTIDADKTIVAVFSQLSTPGSPILNFSDLILGPNTDLDDGLGSGSIVTIWGNNLGNSQNGSVVKFRASDGTVVDAAHVYYWKNSDGQLPGGPANLYESHKMQEIALSIPGSSQGLGELVVVFQERTFLECQSMIATRYRKPLRMGITLRPVITADYFGFASPFDNAIQGSDNTL